jgi:hypothetical protein
MSLALLSSIDKEIMSYYMSELEITLSNATFRLRFISLALALLVSTCVTTGVRMVIDLSHSLKHRKD